MGCTICLLAIALGLSCLPPIGYCTWYTLLLARIRCCGWLHPVHVLLCIGMAWLPARCCNRTTVDALTPCMQRIATTVLTCYAYALLSPPHGAMATSTCTAACVVAAAVCSVHRVLLLPLPPCIGYHGWWVMGHTIVGCLLHGRRDYVVPHLLAMRRGCGVPCYACIQLVGALPVGGLPAACAMHSTGLPYTLLLPLHTTPTPSY